MASRYTAKEDAVRGRWERISPTLDERGRRLFAANEAAQFGFGGVTAVMRATGLAKSTIQRGLRELADLDELAPPPGKVRRPGAGRKRVEDKDPALLAALRELIEPATRGDPESPLLWTSKSASQIAAALKQAGHPVGKTTVLRLLKQEGHTLQGTRKILEGESHEDRDAQFELINNTTKYFQALGQPVISVDTKKKELVGNYTNRGRDWHVEGEGPEVLTYDFPNGGPKAVPYGVYDLARNEGWVSVGTSSDTAEFAVATIRRWWVNVGKSGVPGSN